MSSPASRSEAPVSSGFDRLDERIRRWIWNEGWTELRDAQEQAIPALIDADRDVIIAAATAEGKTEAAFLPILTHLLSADEPGTVLYISPLKALINDQWSRLEALCETLEIRVTGWHGDVAASKKQRFLKKPEGVLLITPESLEALFVNRGSALAGVFARLRYVVIDELHAFIGSERGKQLQALMHRLEDALGRTVPRVGLSATLGDMRLGAEFLRPRHADGVCLVVSRTAGQRLHVQLKGYREAPPDRAPTPEELESGLAVANSAFAVATHLYGVLRGTHNLVFPNSRGQVETYTRLLARHCEREGVPNEFYAHHGSLSKEMREETEKALKDRSRPASAVCTTTLELGIDIGDVKNVCQIGPPPSVASLRQRLGRSGRRKGESAILRGYCIEQPLSSQSGVSDSIREGLTQSIAMVRLLVTGWFEPPRVQGLHCSALVQQILSVIAERGGTTAATLWGLLCQNGPFGAVSKEDFVGLLKHLGLKQLIMQDRTGLLLHGEVGERVVNSYDFYASFATDDEFRLVCGGRTLGSLPVSRPLRPQQRVIFGGRLWRVLDVDSDKQVIVVAPSHGGAPPMFDGESARVHDRVRQEMRAVLAESAPVPFLDAGAASLLEEAREYYCRADLATTELLDQDGEMMLLTWRGDWLNDALALMLAARGVEADNHGVALTLRDSSESAVMTALEHIGRSPAPDPVTVLAEADNVSREKWDWALPAPLLRKSFASLNLDFAGAQDLARGIVARRA